MIHNICLTKYVVFGKKNQKTKTNKKTSELFNDKIFVVKFLSFISSIRSNLKQNSSYLSIYTWIKFYEMETLSSM